MSSGVCSRGPVKVVIINTEYVETDATSFKSVVQKLTGKESDELTTPSGKAQRKRHNQSGVDQVPVVANSGLVGSPFCINDVSFKEFDFDRLLSQMPPMSDLWFD